MANVYEKLQACRVALQSAGLKKSGKNTFAGYDYFELGDFLPAVNRLFAEHKLFSHVSFTHELATLTIINSEKPDEQIVFTSPMAEAKLKAAHEIQNLGAVETYQRRYLYTMALEIVEQDALDATHGTDRPGNQTRGQNAQRPERTGTQANAGGHPQQQPLRSVSQQGGWQISDAQRKRLFAIAKSAGVDNDGVRGLLVTVSGQDSTSKLTRDEYDTICEMLESQAQSQTA